MSDKSNFFHHRVMDPKMDPHQLSSESSSISGSDYQSNSSSGDDLGGDTKLKINKKCIVGVGILMCLAGIFTIDWSGSSSDSKHYAAYGEGGDDSAPDPEYLRIKGRRAEEARSGRGILHSIFCRGNQRSEYCSR